MPQIFVLKLASIKDSKHESAQDGMRLVILEDSVKSEAEVVEVFEEDDEVVVEVGVASTPKRIVVVRVAHSSSSLSRLLTAILGNYRQHVSRQACLSSNRRVVGEHNLSWSHRSPLSLSMLPSFFFSLSLSLFSSFSLSSPHAYNIHDRDLREAL